MVRHGLHDATTDPATVSRWWSRWKRANIGVATGKRTGIIVIDIDLPRALDSLELLAARFPSTLTGLTGGGGIHLLLRAPTDILRCTTARVPGIRGELPGVDVRADGGYIVVPPSLHRSGERYLWLDADYPLAPAPGWLREPERRLRPIVARAPKFSRGGGTPYGRAALEGSLASLRCAPVGQRNHTLNRVAFSLARLIAAGELDEGAVRRALVNEGILIGLTPHESSRTVGSAFAARIGPPTRR